MPRLTPKTSLSLGRVMRRLALSYDKREQAGLHRIEPMWADGAGPDWQTRLKIEVLKIGWQRVGSMASVIDDALESPDGQELLTFNNGSVYWSVKRTGS